MPICAVYAGLSCVSILAIKSPDDKIQLNFPYSYSGYFTIEALIDKFFQDNNLTKSDFQFAFCWYPEVPNLGNSIGLDISLNLLIKEYSGSDSCVFVNRYGVLTQDFAGSCASLNSLNIGSPVNLTQEEIDKINFAFNSYIFPQIIPNNIFDTLEEDNSLRFTNIEPGDKMIITGDRFFERGTNISYILAFDLIKKVGVYDFKIDTNNMWILLELVNKMDEKLGAVLSADTNFMGGTLVNSPGGAECLVSGEEGGDRLLEVKENSILVLPLNKGSKTKITVKGSALNTVQKIVWGGDFGLVIDTRPKNNLTRFREIYTQKNLKTWEDAVCLYRY